MKYKEFMGDVQHRLQFPDLAHAVRSTRAVLTTLGERLHEGEATDLAASLPMEIDRFLLEAESTQRFSFDEFLDRVAERGNVDEPDALRQAQVILQVVSETVAEGEMRQVREVLPDEFDRLFELVGTGSTED